MPMLAFQPAGRSGARGGRAAQAHWGVERNGADCRTEAQRGMGRRFHRLHVIPGQGNQYHWIANQDFPLDGESRSFQCLPPERALWCSGQELGVWGQRDQGKGKLSKLTQLPPTHL